MPEQTHLAPTRNPVVPVTQRGPYAGLTFPRQDAVVTVLDEPGCAGPASPIAPASILEPVPVSQPAPAVRARPRSFGRRVLRALAEEVAQFRCSLLIGAWVGRVLPSGTGARTRAAALRSVGVEIGRGTVIAGALDLVGHTDPRRNFSIGEHGFVNAGCHVDASARVTIGDHVAIARDVLIITHTHAVGSAGRRAAELVSSPVHVGNGCWIGARVTVLPGVTIGDGAVVAAGAVVVDDVPPDAVVAGVPSRVVRRLDRGDGTCRREGARGAFGLFDDAIG